MSRRHRQGLSPSLFPFLAVLVCTLGTLILLLALVAQNAAKAAVAESQQKRNSATDTPRNPRLTAADVESLIEESEFRVQQLIAFRDQQVADIEDRRDQITHLDDHMHRLRAELKRLKDEVKMVTGQQSVSTVDQQTLEDLKSRIEFESERVAELREQSDNLIPRVVIVPHKGPNGTDRRPVYLECTSGGLIIWPEGVRLTEIYLRDSVADANPLDAALRVIRHHAMQNYGDTVAPYPLLVVRPDGIKTYASARQAMRDWDDQFGYELVPADIKLAYDTPDPALKKKLDRTIREAIIKQNSLQRFASGVSRSSGLSQRRRYPTLSAASMDRQGRASGYRNHRDGYTHSNPFAQSADPLEDANQAGMGTGVDAASKLQQQLRDARGDLGPSRLGDRPLGSGYIGDVADAGEIKADAASESSGSYSSELRDPLAGSSSESLDSTRNSHSLSDSLGGNRSDAVAIGDQRQGQEGDSRSTRFADLASDSSVGQQGDENAKTNRFLADNSAAQQPAASDTEPTGSSQNGAASSSEQMSTSGASSVASTRDASAAMTMPESETPPSINMRQPANLPQSTPSNASQLVRRQGTNWALPKHVANSSGNEIVRTIRVLCYPDRFVLLPPRGEGRIEMFGLADGDINRATLELATAIRDRIVRWGAALPGGRWQPRLNVEIMPHGEQRFHQLRVLMSGSGVDVDGRPSK